jgi:hypothetical protein
VGYTSEDEHEREDTSKIHGWGYASKNECEWEGMNENKRTKVREEPALEREGSTVRERGWVVRE